MKATIFCYTIGFFIAVTVTGCTGNNNSTSVTGSSDTSISVSVETQKPNSRYKPAFEGQTRINAVKTTTPYISKKIAEGLGRPWAIIALQSDRLLITEKSGFMEIRDTNGTLVKKITGFPEVDNDGQGGMLDVALDPFFEKNNIIYWSFSQKVDPGNLTAVAKGKLNVMAGIIENPTVIFQATPALESDLHFGSRLIFDKDGNLFVSTGERSIREGRSQAQLLQSGLGKLFKITTDGKPAPGNPFLNQAGTMPEIYAYGIRNSQSLDINPVTGDLWEAEFGPRGGDEINIIKPGKNYGWPVITYGIEYSGEPIGDPIQHKEGMEQPVYYWDPVISPSGMSFYKGNTIPEWENNLFIGCLSGSHIARLVINNNKVVGEERLLTGMQERFRDVDYVNGMLFTVTDNGSLYRISRQ